ncbi:hypothetical protein CVIRNUC_006691 [Coccomyxa viridis]|uniref:SnoaL-like domain-containing protein n=1 Tax=Coccomyxa viridis TaxID=1274662 RepID=A0AAV1IB92_9CHLO|nr:hypothetical protein CVIRNUC_006691 [Coccomyxa viridis]
MTKALLGHAMPLINRAHTLRATPQPCFGASRPHKPPKVGCRQSVGTTHVPRASPSEAAELSSADLQVMLEDAIRQENYQEAARLRDVLTQRESDSKSAVEDANAKFYSAFRNRDLKAMSHIWGRGEHVQCIHPAAGCIAGRENVLESWQLVLRGQPMDINVEDVRVYARDGAAFVTCTEVMEAGNSRGRTIATNVFEKQEGRWVLVHHHGGPAPIFV